MSDLSPFTIPIVDLRAQYRTIRERIIHAIDQVNESQQFILGPAVKNFESQMAAYLQCGSAIGVASGSDALLLSLMALGIGPGDAVITTPFTFFATVSSITRLGARPLFVDIEPDSYLLSVKGIEAILADRNNLPDSRHIRAILPVHLFGQCCEMNELVDLARKNDLRIVEDVAQACGARMSIGEEKKFAGVIGDLGCFSFFPSKNLGGFGDGGMVTTDNLELADKIRMLRVHGERTKYYHEATGINSRLDSLQAAILAVKQQFLESWCDDRVQHAIRYHELFKHKDLLGRGVLAVPTHGMDKSHVFNNYVVRVERRDELKQYLAEHRVQSEVYYPLPLHLQPCFAELGCRRGQYPQAELAADQVLALPIYPEITQAQQEFIVETVRAFYHG